MEDLATAEARRLDVRRLAETRIRDAVRMSVGQELTEMSVASAMRVYTPHSYRCAILAEAASPVALAAGWCR